MNDILLDNNAVKDVFDVIIIGLGAMGSSASYYLSKKGKRVLGIDKLKPPHNYGSSHGESRIIREAYFEHPLYVPLVQRAYELWDQLEVESNKNLFLQTGGLMLGDVDSSIVKGSELSAKTYNLDYQKLDHTEIKNNYPGFNPNKETVGILEKRAGILFPEKCINTYLELSEKLGATLNYNEKVIDWKTEENIIKVITDKNEYYARKIVFTTGAWIKEMIPELSEDLLVTRQVLFWYNTEKNEKYIPENFPIYIWEYERDKMFYGFPDIGNGLKIAFHHLGKETNPDNLEKDVDENEKYEMEDIITRYLPEVINKLIKTETCMYTNTKDQNFIIDTHPQYENVIVASPCSGHGFKFSSVIGEIISKIANEEKLNFDLTPFRFKRS